MRHALALLLGLLLLLSFTAPSFAASGSEEQTLELHVSIPPATMTSDIGEPNLWPTLNVVFPGVLFDANDRVVEQSLAGTRTSLLWQEQDDDMLLIFNGGYYLMAYQLQAYEKELAKLGVYYPLRKTLVDAQEKEPTSARQTLIRMLGVLTLPG